MKALIAASLILLSGFLALHAGEPASDLDRLQGTWLVVSLSEKGKPIAAKETDALEIVIDKDTFTTFEKGKIVVKYQLKLDSAKSPKHINFTYLVGDDKGKTELGIYAFEKDQIKLCLDEDNKGRPTVFEGKGTEGCSVIVLKKKEK
jgi:uncharacterized protein (TIGR03067 family)